MNSRINDSGMSQRTYKQGVAGVQIRTLLLPPLLLSLSPCVSPSFFSLTTHQLSASVVHVLRNMGSALLRFWHQLLTKGWFDFLVPDPKILSDAWDQLTVVKGLWNCEWSNLSPYVHLPCLLP